MIPLIFYLQTKFSLSATFKNDTEFSSSGMAEMSSEAFP
jgi:hypothetical protein